MLTLRKVFHKDKPCSELELGQGNFKNYQDNFLISFCVVILNLAM